MLHRSNKNNIFYLLLMLFIATIFVGCESDVSTINVSSKSGQLQMLRVSGLALSPTFEISQKHYVSTADFDVTKINLQAWANSPKDSILVNGQLIDDKSDFNLAVGNNIFTIVVTNSEDISVNYRLTITRLSEISSN